MIPRSLGFSFGTKREPALWIADTVAGAVAARRCDGPTFYLDALRPQVTIEDISGV
jgi:hypothetical protein